MTFVNQPGPPQVNPRDLMLQTQHDPMSTANKFDSILDTAGGIMSGPFGQMGGLLANRFGGKIGAMATSSVLSGFSNGSTPGYSYNASGNGGTFSSGYGPGKMLTMPGAPPGYPGSSGGGGSLGAPPGYPGGSSTGAPGGGMNMNASVDPSQFDSNINSMMNNNLVFLAIQTKVQNVSQTTQLMSNIFKADSDAKLNAIRNVRG